MGTLSLSLIFDCLYKVFSSKLNLELQPDYAFINLPKANCERSIYTGWNWTARSFHGLRWVIWLGRQFGHGLGPWAVRLANSLGNPRYPFWPSIFVAWTKWTKIWHVFDCFALLFWDVGDSIDQVHRLFDIEDQDVCRDIVVVHASAVIFSWFLCYWVPGSIVMHCMWNLAPCGLEVIWRLLIFAHPLEEVGCCSFSGLEWANFGAHCPLMHKATASCWSQMSRYIHSQSTSCHTDGCFPIMFGYIFSTIISLSDQGKTETEMAAHSGSLANHAQIKQGTVAAHLVPEEAK